MDFLTKTITAIRTFICIVSIIIIAIVLIKYIRSIDAISAILCNLNAEIITAVMSAVIAGCVLLVTVRQKHQNLLYNQLSVIPLIASNLIDATGGDDSGRLRFDLVNHGNGPAIITKIVLFFNDGEKSEELQDSSKKYFDFIKRKLKKFNEDVYGFVVPNSVMKVGNKQIIWDVTDTSTTNNNISIIRKLDLLVEYKSVYQDKIYTYDTRKDIKFKELKKS